MLAESSEPLTPHQREMVLLTNEQSDRLTRLVKGILNVSRINAGQMNLSPEAFDMLYISRELIENMGGKLWVESELGSGSTFYFALPLAGQTG